MLTDGCLCVREQNHTESRLKPGRLSYDRSAHVTASSLSSAVLKRIVPAFGRSLDADLGTLVLWITFAVALHEVRKISSDFQLRSDEHRHHQGSRFQEDRDRSSVHQRPTWL